MRFGEKQNTPWISCVRTTGEKSRIGTDNKPGGRICGYLMAKSAVLKSSIYLTQGQSDRLNIITTIFE